MPAQPGFLSWRPAAGVIVVVRNVHTRFLDDEGTLPDHEDPGPKETVALMIRGEISLL
jgi:hypothetical protein